MTEKITCTEGNIKTSIPFLTINRHTYASPLTLSVLTHSFCIILQGMKETSFGKGIGLLLCRRLVASLIDIPASGQIVNASKDLPFIGLRVDFTTKEIASVAMEVVYESPSQFSREYRRPLVYHQNKILNG